MTAPQDSIPSGNTYAIDPESPSEMARLLDQDLLFNRIMGGVLAEQEDVSRFHDVLDLACGPGGWILEVAREYPEIEATGIDISKTMVNYARAHAKARGLDNAHFKIMDALQLEEISDNSFDLVNGRALVGFMFPSAWHTLLQECFRICRPGGIVRMTEWELPLTNSPAFEEIKATSLQAMQVAHRNFSPDGRNFGITPVLARLLRDTGFQNIQQKAHVVNFSAGTEAHEGFYHNFRVAFLLGLPFMMKMGVTTQEKFDRVYQQMLAEMLSDDFCAVGFLLTVWGEKP